MYRVLLCVRTEHDWRLVALAAVVCVSATLATLFLYSKAPGFPLWRRWCWLGMTGLVAGSGIWTTHFVAMLAFKTGLPTGYAVAPTFASLGMAIVSTTLGFAVGSARTGRGRGATAPILGGLIVGLGITLMHYLGMSGYRTAGRVQWDGAYIVASVVIGAVLATAALLAARPGSPPKRQLIGSGLLTLAIVGMHFTGMTAVTIVPDAGVIVPPSLLSIPAMVVISVAVTAIILVTAIGGVAFDAATRNGSLRKLRQALDVMPDGLAFYDSADRLVAWNTQYEEICQAAGAVLTEGMPYADLLQSHVAHGLYPDARGRETEWIAQRHAAHSGEVDSFTGRTDQGRWLRVTDRKTADGSTVSVSVDVTELKCAELVITEARDRAEKMARRAEAAEAVAGLGHWRLNVKTQAVVWSPQMYVIYGLDPDAPLDLHTLMDMIHEDDRAKSRQTLALQMEGGAMRDDSIIRIHRPDGETRYLSSKSSVECDAAGLAACVIGTLVDVTEQKLLEGRLRQAQADAEAAAAVKSEFLANMSHELRTPLTSIIGFTNLAATQPELSVLSRTYVSRVRDASQALLCTVNDILDFSKLEAGQLSIQPRPTAVADLCRSTLDLFAPQAAAKDVDLVYDDAGADELLLAIDPDRIRQILLNLVSNAVKFTDKGQVRLSSRYDAAGGLLWVEVADSGAGIPQDKQARLFQRFSQIDGSLTRAGGTGLGLAICKGLVEAMGGQIGVDSGSGAGSRFWFSIPAPLAAVGDTPVQSADLAHLSALAVRVLVVDDHPANRQIAGLYLAGIGAEVTEAVDGEDAVRLASEWPFDVILMDIRMPKLDGHGALRQIRACGGPNDETPILAFTADADASLAEAMTARGFQGVVSKPVEAAALIAAVAKAAIIEPFPSEPARQAG
jgi:PAS domain S-box-containing protein